MKTIKFLMASVLVGFGVVASAQSVTGSVAWEATKVVGGGHNGTIDIKSADLEWKKGSLSGGTVTVDMTSLVSTDLEGEWKTKLEGHLYSDDFFSVEKFPTSTVELTSVKKKGDKYMVKGNVTIKSITQAEEFEVMESKDGGKTVYTAKVVLDRTKYDVRYGSNSFFDDLGDKAISDEFTLDVKLEMNGSATASAGGDK